MVIGASMAGLCGARVLADRFTRVVVLDRDVDGRSEALERAGRDHLEVAVRAGGHSVAGMSTNDDGLVVDIGLATEALARALAPLRTFARIGSSEVTESGIIAQGHGRLARPFRRL